MTQTITACKGKTHSAPILFFALTILLLTSGCQVGTSVGMGVGTGNTRVGIGMGGGGTSIGVGYSGLGVRMSSAKDYLNSGPNEAFRNNETGVGQLLDGDYEAARATFEATLADYPDQPDAVYYLGLTHIYLDEREEGFTLLKSYREPNHYRATRAVQDTAAYLEKKPELDAETIHKTMNRERMDGFNRDRENRWERMP